MNQDSIGVDFNDMYLAYPQVQDYKLVPAIPFNRVPGAGDTNYKNLTVAAFGNGSTTRLFIRTGSDGADAIWQELGITAGGIATVAEGGTGLGTLTDHAVIVGAGTDPVEFVGPGSAGQVFQSGGASANPAYSTATYPSIATGTGTFLRADGTNWVASTATVPNTATQGDLLYASADNVWTSLNKSATPGQVLTNDGTLNAPVWAPASGGISEGFSNLGMSYNGGTGTLSITGSTAPLSATNPAFIYLQSKATPGLLTRYTITADQSFIDDVGASEIAGNLFGWTTGVAITVDVPFYVYAVTNDAETSIAFMLSRYPHRALSPATIGQPGDPIADAEGDFWSIDAVTASEYDQNPCVAVGSFRMQMSAADDWTVQALTTSDGIGNFQDNREFIVPLGQKGAAAGSWSLDNGGTAPIFTAYEIYRYKLTQDGLAHVHFSMNGDGGADGAGAVSASLISPVNSTDSVFILGSALIQTPTYNETGACSLGGALPTQAVLFRRASNAAPVQWDAFSNGNRTLRGTLVYPIAN